MSVTLQPVFATAVKFRATLSGEEASGVHGDVPVTEQSCRALVMSSAQQAFLPPGRKLQP